MRFKDWSYRFAEEILNSRLTQKHEIIDIVENISLPPEDMSRPNLNEAFKEDFEAKGWDAEVAVFDPKDEPAAKIDFMKNRIGVEVQLGHSSFIGIDLLKLQTMSYSYKNNIDIGVYIVSTKKFQKMMKKKYDQSWGGSLRFKKVARYLPHFRNSINVPVWVIGLDGV